MIGSSLTGVLNVKAPGADLGERLFASLQSLASTTLSTVTEGGEKIMQMFRAVVVPAVEPLPGRAVNAVAWVNGRLLDGIDFVASSAAASISFVDSEIRDLRERTRHLVDQSVHAGLHRLGVPTQEEVTALSHRMDRIAATVERLKRQVEPKATPRRTARGTARRA